MLKKCLLLIMMICFVFQADAQYKRGKLKRKNAEAGIHLNLGYYGNPHWSVGTNIQYTWGIGHEIQRFNFGAGLRTNSFFTKKRYYKTASPELTALNPAGADSLYIQKVQTNTLNAYFIFMFHIKKGVDIYFTTDIGGINFGDSRQAYFVSYETAPTIEDANKYKTEPYAFNLNMWEDNSFGTINSEVYGNFSLSNTLRWRLGVNYMRNEYILNRDIPLNGRRFSQRHYMVFTGLAFNLRKQKTDPRQY